MHTGARSISSPRTVLLVVVLWAAGLGAAAQFGKISVLCDLLGARYAGHGGPIRIGLLVSRCRNAAGLAAFRKKKPCKARIVHLSFTLSDWRLGLTDLCKTSRC